MKYKVKYRYDKFAIDTDIFITVMITLWVIFLFIFLVVEFTNPVHKLCFAGDFNVKTEQVIESRTATENINAILNLENSNDAKCDFNNYDDAYWYAKAIEGINNRIMTSIYKIDNCYKIIDNYGHYWHK